MLLNAFKKVYLYLESVPDRFYPFRAEIEGQLVRGRASYEAAVEAAWRKYGPHRLGYRLTVYRGMFHFLGSVLFMVFATVLSQQLFGNEIALYVLLGAATAALFFQEFYEHPRRRQQLRRKGVIDWLTWVIPMLVYLVFF